MRSGIKLLSTACIGTEKSSKDEYFHDDIELGSFTFELGSTQT